MPLFTLCNRNQRVVDNWLLVNLSNSENHVTHSAWKTFPRKRIMLRLYLGLGYMILFRFQYDNNSHWRSAWDVSSILSFGPVGKMGKRLMLFGPITLTVQRTFVFSFIFSRRISDTNKYCSFLLQTYHKTF